MTQPPRIPVPSSTIIEASPSPLDAAAGGDAPLVGAGPYGEGPHGEGQDGDPRASLGGRRLCFEASIDAKATDGAPARFIGRVRRGFGRGAASYEAQARLQQGVAWRLGRLCRDLPLPAGPCADLGAGSGLLSRALLAQRPSLPRSPQQLDLCPELLARNPLAGPGALPWDLNRGLPPELTEASLLLSSFALQWLEDPAAQLGHWACRLAPGGWLALAVPVAGSFDAWQTAARAASVPCTALPLPGAEALIEAAIRAGLDLRRCQRLRFSRAPRDGLATLRLLRCLGATASRQPPLNAGQLRRLLAHWPAAPLRWEVLLIVGRSAGSASGPPS